MNQIECCKAMTSCLDYIPEGTDDSIDLKSGLTKQKIEDKDCFFIMIAAVSTSEGIGAFDSAINFCPFCGKQLSDPLLDLEKSIEGLDR